MAIAPWTATCIQTASKLAVKGDDRAAAWSIICHHFFFVGSASGQSPQPAQRHRDSEANNEDARSKWGVDQVLELLVTRSRFCLHFVGVPPLHPMRPRNYSAIE